MPRPRSLLVAALMIVAAPGARAEDAQFCRIIEVEYTPVEDLQVVAWLERADGTFLETLYITAATGSYGLGNRPGILDFNSSWAWPYGRRESTFPIWAHRHGDEWPQLVFQDGFDRNLSHDGDLSSHETYYCRPLLEGEPQWDAETCATVVWTDKGLFSTSLVSLYPPRNDITYDPLRDSDDVPAFAGMNPFDAVSQATPPGLVPFVISYAMPRDLTDGDYVVWVEVGKEFDQNASYDYPSPEGIAYGEYGLAYRGQPSVVYTLPFTITAGDEVDASTDAYAGYGDPDGISGDVNPPDGTITEGVDGSGASRLLLTEQEGELARVRLRARPAFDIESPGAPAQLVSVDVQPDQATLAFVAPGDDGDEGTAKGYDIRFQASSPIDDENFLSAQPADTPFMVPRPPGSAETFTMRGLLPATNYYVAVRSFDDCLNRGPVATVLITTPRRPAGEVDACFIATAAWGSPMQADVAALRRFRDVALRTHVAGELLVEGYYTFGPLLARAIGPSDTMRALARTALEPIVAAVRGGARRSLLGRLF